jgi:hypothetical protein
VEDTRREQKAKLSRRAKGKTMSVRPRTVADLIAEEAAKVPCACAWCNPDNARLGQLQENCRQLQRREELQWKFLFLFGPGYTSLPASVAAEALASAAPEAREAPETPVNDSKPLPFCKCEFCNQNLDNAGAFGVPPRNCTGGLPFTKLFTKFEYFKGPAPRRVRPLTLAQRAALWRTPHWLALRALQAALRAARNRGR